MIPLRQQNSFDLLRLLFALSVLFTHAYFITGVTDRDLLSRISQKTYHYPHIAVPGFFIISGFLVVQSLHRSISVQDYLLRRIVRIYPGLFVMLLSTLLLGWAVYSGSFRQYISNPEVYVYFAKNLLMLHQYVMSGFFKGNPADDIINISIWSIPYEVIFYLLLTFFFRIPKQKQFAVALVIYLFLMLNLILTHHQVGIPDAMFENITVLNLFRYGSFFFAGVALGLVPQFVRTNRKILLAISATFLFFLFQSHLPVYLLNLLLPIFIISLGLFEAPDWVSSIIKKTGDPSYGIYIYGFPVQQTLFYYLKPGYWQLAFLSVLVLTIIGICSWKFVEKSSLLFFRKQLALKGR